MAALTGGTAYAGAGQRLVDQDAEATSRGTAFTATADNPSAIFYNPAGITQLPGLQFRTGVYGIGIDSRYSGPGGTSTKNRQEIGLPAQFYATWSPSNLPFSLGLGIYSPFGLNLIYPDSAPFRTVAKVGKVEYVTLNPVIGWKILPQLSFAAGPTFNYVHGELSRGLFERGDDFDVRASGMAYGFNTGLLWQPTPQHSFGVRYNAETTAALSGHTQVETKPFIVPTPFGPFHVPGTSSIQEASGDLRFPQFVTLAYSFRPTPEWNFEFDADWTDWSSVKELTINRKGAATVNVPFYLKSNWIFSLGATRSWSNGWHVSAGYIYCETMSPDKTFTPIVPDYERNAFAVGCGYKAARWNFDLAYQYSFQPERHISQGTAADGTYHLQTNAITLSVGLKF